MSLNCHTCTHKKNVSIEGHCTEFSHIPELDSCAMHSASAAVQAANSKPTGEFLWLRQTHQSAEVSLKQPQQPVQ